MLCKACFLMSVPHSKLRLYLFVAGQADFCLFVCLFDIKRCIQEIIDAVQSSFALCFSG